MPCNLGGELSLLWASAWSDFCHALSMSESTTGFTLAFYILSCVFYLGTSSFLFTCLDFSSSGDFIACSIRDLIPPFPATLRFVLTTPVFSYFFSSYSNDLYALLDARDDVGLED